MKSNLTYSFDDECYNDFIIKGDDVMYHWIVKKRLTNSFKALNEGRYDVITKQFHKTKATHWFSGDHPLSGLRTNYNDILLWYERLAILMPDLSFTITKIAVKGLPCKTTAYIHWTDTLSDRMGTRYHNKGLHIITIKWGKVVGLEVYCDTDYLNTYIEALVKQGVKEAQLPPIES